MPKATELADELNVLEARRLVATIRAREKLIAAMEQLLPAAIAAAAPKPECPHCHRPATRGSPALLRLVTRALMRDVRLDRPPKR